MTVFLSTLNQMAFLLLLIGIGYLLAKLRAVPENTATALSKLENNVFIPALVLSTFLENCTVEKLGQAWQYLLGGFIAAVICVVLATTAARFCSRDGYIRKIYTYGLAFSNFGFMGNAVVKALFPEIFMEYLIFTLPFWLLIYLYGVPALLIPPEGDTKGWKARLKPLLNPMFLAMAAGIVLGLLSPELPAFLTKAAETLGGCMSPVAMLLTGITIAGFDLKATFRSRSIYAVCFLRLVALPLLFLAAAAAAKLPRSLAVCIVAAQAMPLGLNTIVIPSAYGRDTSTAAGMALISHLLSGVTIPAVFLLFEKIIA